MGDALKREDATEANGWVLVPELFDGLRESVGNLPIVEGRQILIGNAQAQNDCDTTDELDESGSQLVLEPDSVIGLVFVGPEASPPQIPAWRPDHKTANKDKNEKAEGRYQYRGHGTQFVISQRALPVTGGAGLGCAVLF
jgi:hypothetical protein